MKVIWKGSIGFGLVNIPVKMYTAIQSHTLHLEMLELCHARFARVCRDDGKEIPYLHSWLKIKTVNTMDVIICVYTAPRGSRKFFGALKPGLYDKNELIYIGHTGTGFNYSAQEQDFKLMQKYIRARSSFVKPPKPNASLNWLKPALVCGVEYSHLTGGGIMRHPVFAEIRSDKNAEDATLKSQIKII